MEFHANTAVSSAWRLLEHLDVVAIVHQQHRKFHYNPGNMAGKEMGIRKKSEEQVKADKKKNRPEGGRVLAISHGLGIR